MPRQYSVTRERDKEWATPTQDELSTLGLMDQEIGYALDIWPSLLTSYFEVISGNPAGFDQLDMIGEDLSEALAGAIKGAQALGGGGKHVSAFDSNASGYDPSTNYDPSVDFDPSYAMPPEVDQKIDQLRERSLGRFRVEMDRIRSIDGEERAEEYARAVGPGYATSTPFAQASALYEREFQPAYSRGIADILNASDAGSLAQQQFYSGLGSENERFLAELVGRNKQFGAGLAEENKRFGADLGFRYDELGKRDEQQRLGTLGNLYTNVLGLGSNRRNQELEELMRSLNMLSYGSGLRQTGAEAYAPFRLDQSVGAGGTGGRVSSGSSGGGILESALGGATSAFGKAIGGPAGEGIVKILGNIF